MSETFEEWWTNNQEEPVESAIVIETCDLKMAAREAWNHRQQKIDKLERDNEVLKEACEKITTLQLLDYDLVDARVFADKALFKIRGEG